MLKQNGIIIALLHTFLINHAYADMAEAEAEAKEIIELAKNNTTTNKVGDIPGFVGTNVPETCYNENNIETAKFQAAAKDETFNLIKESIEKRPPFEIDVIKDPMFVASNKALTEAEVIEVEPETPSFSEHKCLRGKNFYESKCHITLVPVLTGIRKELKTKRVEVSNKFNLPQNISWSLYQTGSCRCTCTANHAPIRDKNVLSVIIASIGIPDKNINSESIRSIKWVGHNNHCWELYGVFGKEPSWYVPSTKNTYEITYDAEIPIYELAPQSSCDALEDSVDESKCLLVSRECIDSEKTKTLHDQTFTADCWKEELTYRCFSDEKNSCKSLLEKGCIQTNSVCKTKDGDDCIEWEQTFKCYDKQSLTKTKINTDAYPCLNGDCVDQSWEPNTDMADSLSKLAIFKEMQKDMDPEAQTVFKGENLECSRVAAGVKNCCVQKGWGMKVGLAECNADEKKLAKQRQQNKCIQVGTYCAEKALGKCIRKKTSFCCYGSKLSRIMNEQAISQLGMSLGSPEHPRCSVLTLTNFTRIDFSKINFSELFQDITTKTKIPNVSAITKGIQSSMDDNKRLLTDKKNKITQGRSNANF